MTIILSQVEADCFKKELSITCQQELEELVREIFKDAAEFVTAEMCDDGTIKIIGSDIYVMNVFNAMRDKIAYIAGIKTIGLSTIKTGMTLISDIKRDYRLAVEKSKLLTNKDREVSDDFECIISRNKINKIGGTRRIFGR